MNTNILNQKGDIVGKTDLPKEIFEVPMNLDLVYQVAVSQMSNRRQVVAQTKDRSEVRGGGKKPWRQKGTGRARHGSIRSPIWKGGGVTFGPTNQRNFKKTIPKKMRRKALFMVLSIKAKENLLLVLDDLKIEKPKTKLIIEVFRKLFLEKGSGLILLPKSDKNIILAGRNIPKTLTMQAKDLNVLDMLNYKYIVMPKEAIDVIKDTFLKK